MKKKKPEDLKGAVGEEEEPALASMLRSVATSALRSAALRPATTSLAQPRYDEPEVVLAGLVKLGAYDLAKAFIDFIKEKRSKSPQV